MLSTTPERKLNVLGFTTTARRVISIFICNIGAYLIMLAVIKLTILGGA